MMVVSIELVGTSLLAMMKWLTQNAIIAAGNQDLNPAYDLILEIEAFLAALALLGFCGISGT